MTTTASEDRKDVLQKWKDVTANRKMILAVIGRSGTGKTTLINSMLGVECERRWRNHYCYSFPWHRH
jgi:ABC-type lipoprotein export system ATPase subunit